MLLVLIVALHNFIMWFDFLVLKPPDTNMHIEDPVQLRREIEEWMANYDEKQEEKKRLARESQVDEDGFTKVISGITRTPDGLTIRGAPRPAMKIGAFAEAMAGKASETVSSSKKKKKTKEMPDFYRFQQREKRREEIIDHRKRNAKDMDTVKQMKKAGLEYFAVPLMIQNLGCCR